MIIAAVVLASISLLVSVVTLSLVLGKQFFSSHKIQMVPLNTDFDFATGKPAASPYADIEDPFDEESELK